MAEPRTEAALQRRIWKAVVRRWPSAWLFHPVGSPYQMPGIPDLLCCVKGRLIGMELKNRRPGESLSHAILRATTQQQKQIDLINAAGGKAGVVTSVKEALDLIEEALAA